MAITLGQGLKTAGTLLSLVNPVVGGAVAGGGALIERSELQKDAKRKEEELRKKKFAEAQNLERGSDLTSLDNTNDLALAESPNVSPQTETLSSDKRTAVGSETPLETPVNAEQQLTTTPAIGGTVTRAQNLNRAAGIIGVGANLASMINTVTGDQPEQIQAETFTPETINPKTSVREAEAKKSRDRAVAAELKRKRIAGVSDTRDVLAAEMAQEGQDLANIEAGEQQTEQFNVQQTNRADLANIGSRQQVAAQNQQIEAQERAVRGQVFSQSSQNIISNLNALSQGEVNFAGLNRNQNIAEINQIDQDINNLSMSGGSAEQINKLRQRKILLEQSLNL